MGSRGCAFIHKDLDLDLILMCYFILNTRPIQFIGYKIRLSHLHK